MSEHATDEEAVQQMLLLDAAEQTYLQAINDCLQGNTAAADASLTTLGCTQRLSAAIWQAAATSHPHNTPQQQQQPRQSPVAVCDCPLPPDLLSALQAAFDGGALDDNSSSSSSSSSDFWQLHDYDDPATPFFSYLIDLQAAAAKLAAAAAAAGSRASGGPATACQQQQDLPNALELSALLLQQHISQLTLPATAAADSPTAAAMAEAARRATHVEWWTHTRPPWAPHQLHFDAAEGAFRHGLGEYRLLHPALSSVVYLTATGGPTVVLEQDSRGATDWQQQQQQQQGSPSPYSGAGSEPPCKRSKPAAQQPAEVKGLADDHQHHHQQQQQQQSQQQRPLLARHGTCIHPQAGRFAVWPGNLLHGVLPGGRIPLETDATAAAAAAAAAAGGGGGGPESAPEAAAAAAAAVAAGAKSDGAVRTSLMLAWWQGDPRQLAAAHHTAAAAVTADGQASDPQPTGSLPPPPPAAAAEAAAAAVAAGTAAKEREGDVPGKQLCPCMPMPATHPVTSSTPKWLQALTLPPQQLLQLLPAVQESQLSFSNNNSTAAAAAAWRLLPSVSPAWELVRQQAAAAVPQDQQEHQQQPQQQQQQQVELPCLRLFLRNARDIRAAYIPSLDEWLQSDVPADAAVADV